MYTRNYDPNFWKTKHPECNCGSYALNVKEWVSLPDNEDEEDEISQKMYDHYLDGGNRETIATLIGEYLVSILLDKFHFIHSIPKKEAEKYNNNIVAFRVGVNVDEYYNEDDEDNEDPEVTFDYDYHFCILKNGIWFEKNGVGPIHTHNDYIMNPWDSPSEDEPGFYNGKIYFFKIDN